MAPLRGPQPPPGAPRDRPGRDVAPGPGGSPCRFQIGVVDKPSEANRRCPSGPHRLGTIGRARPSLGPGRHLRPPPIQAALRSVDDTCPWLSTSAGASTRSRSPRHAAASVLITLLLSAPGR